MCFSLEDSQLFYEVFEKRDKIINYLTEEITKKGKKEKVLILFNTI